MKIDKPVESNNFWDDESFQDRLVALLVFDPLALQHCATLLTAEDFRPMRGTFNGNERWVVAERALEHWQKYHEPLGKLLRADVLEYAANITMGSLQINKLKDYVRLVSDVKTPSPDAITQKVIRYKGERFRAAAIQELIDLQATGMLTDEKFSEVSIRATAAKANGSDTTSYLLTMEDRIARRRLESIHSRIPWTFIDPLDSITRCVGPKQLGMVMAPYKRGKSQFLLWICVAYALQRLNVLHVTLEDPRHICEDRLDSIVTHVPVKRLNEFPRTLTKKFDRFRGMVKTNVEIYDGTEGGVTVAVIERVLLALRDKGFRADALTVDYDEEVTPSKSYKDKIEESDDVYRSLRTLASRHNLIAWTAAQTQRDTKHMKILSGDRVAKDIGKMKKVSVGLSLGKGEWTDDSIFAWVAAHKNGRQEIGCEIVPDFSRSLIYSREDTEREMRRNLTP